MGVHSDLIAADLDGINPQETAGHLRAIAALSKTQLAGMLGWAQQEQDRDAYRIAFELFHQARPTEPVLDMLLGEWLDANAADCADAPGGCNHEPSADAPDWDEADHASAEPWTKQTLLRHLHEQHDRDRSHLGDPKASLVEWHAWLHAGE